MTTTTTTKKTVKKTMDKLAALFCIVMASAVAMSSPAEAQDATRETEARSVFEAGQIAFDDAQYEDALVYFKRAHDLSHRPVLLFNIALCFDRLRNDEMAIAAYEQYVAAMPSTTDHREVDGRLEALRQAHMRRLAFRPENVAHAANEPQTQSPIRPVPSATPIYETWWFWTIVGAVVVGSTAAVVVATSGDEPLPTSDLGGVIFTLWSSR